MARVYEDITAAVGHTPLVRLKRMAKPGAEVLAKMESMNHGGSVKDRVAVSMIEVAGKQGLIYKDTVLFEPTSGNTGIGCAFVCASREYRLVLTMSKSVSVERRKLLRMLGAGIVLTQAAMGMTGAVEEARQLCRETSNAVSLQQFTNPVNPEVHHQATALEIRGDTDGKIAG